MCEEGVRDPFTIINKSLNKLYVVIYSKRQVLVFVTAADEVTTRSMLTLQGHIKSAQQWTIIQQYDNLYTGR